jgi:hypothetical protein
MLSMMPHPHMMYHVVGLLIVVVVAVSATVTVSPLRPWVSRAAKNSAVVHLRALFLGSLPITLTIYT